MDVPVVPDPTYYFSHEPQVQSPHYDVEIAHSMQRRLGGTSSAPPTERRPAVSPSAPRFRVPKRRQTQASKTIRRYPTPWPVPYAPMSEVYAGMHKYNERPITEKVAHPQAVGHTNLSRVWYNTRCTETEVVDGKKVRCQPRGCTQK